MRRHDLARLFGVSARRCWAPHEPHRFHEIARFATYNTPRDSVVSAVDYKLRLTPCLAKLKPAFDALRADRQQELSRDQLLELCPRLQPELADSLHGAFDKISYDEVCAYVVAGSLGGIEERLEILFPLCDVDGQNEIEASQLMSIVKLLYHICYKDSDYVTFKSDKFRTELLSFFNEDEEFSQRFHREDEDNKFSFRQFIEWIRGDSPSARELGSVVSKLSNVSRGRGSETWSIQARAEFEKIKVENTIVELDGDEMTRILWQKIKEKLIFPYLDMEIDYYDLSITYRDETEDGVTMMAAEAIQTHNVGIKCPTIIPDDKRLVEFNLSNMWKSPNGTLRNFLDGTVFRVPIIIENVSRPVPGWEKPIVVGRHSHADEYMSSELSREQSGTFKLVFESDDGETTEVLAQKFEPSTGMGVMMGMFNTKESVEKYAQCCFEYALSLAMPLYFTSKQSILTTYDGLFAEVFQTMYETSYKKAFEDAGLWYEHRMIDDMVAQVIKSKGGFVWACKNYDGDVISDLVSHGCGSLGLITSILVCPDGKTVLTEAAHGTITKHYRAHQRGEKTSTNPIASIFAWSRGLAHRGKLDGNDKLIGFSKALEEACVTCVEKGQMSKDLAVSLHGDGVNSDQWLATEEFIDAIATQLRLVLTKPLRKSKDAQEAPFTEGVEGLDRNRDKAE